MGGFWDHFNPIRSWIQDPGITVMGVRAEKRMIKYCLSSEVYNHGGLLTRIIIILRHNDDIVGRNTL